ncbi:hypothetical protein NEF87_003049 [Candidatus Lokiarchaeum ossiferum]|uniref:Uncharacterized protein n=1 Tax=Candidatus Lokiarchaeum ossiferum TaxID=2951803 RepID=A0ABY6HTC3_9ARCH|nr:hypothetical protein NEF87_003049 [Candidatus Lokiarchaeum sp. B-35]
MLNEGLSHLGIEIVQTREDFFYTMTFPDYKSFNLLFRNFFLHYPIVSTKTSKNNSPFVLTFAFDEIPQELCDEELIELMTLSLEMMGLKLVSLAEVGLHHIPFIDMDSFLVLLYGLIQNLNKSLII